MRNSEADIIGDRVVRDQTAGLGLFDAAREPVEDPATPPPPRRGSTRSAPNDADDQPSSDRTEAIQRLKQLIEGPLLERAEARINQQNAPGVVADDAVQLCKSHHWAALLGTGQRAFSWVGPWMAQLARDGKLREFCLAGQVVRRRSTRPDSHGNLQIVYLHPRDMRAVGRAA